MGKFIDLTGNTYGRWSVQSQATSRNKNSYWVCQCICGTVKEIAGNSLKNGDSSSCGCYLKEVNTIHGETKNATSSRLYRIWANMWTRCTNPKTNDFEQYGGKDITICSTWENFINFKDWAIANNYSDLLTLDRIDVSGGYSSKNCRWVTTTAQARNKSVHKNSSSGYTGVYFRKKENKYVVTITVNKKRIYIGITNTKEEGALLRNQYIVDNKLEFFKLAII